MLKLQRSALLIICLVLCGGLGACTDPAEDDDTSSPTPSPISVTPSPLPVTPSPSPIPVTPSLEPVTPTATEPPSPDVTATPLPVTPSPIPDTPEPATDADGDGTASLEDCNDQDPSVHPDAPERCNALDDDCDGEIDEGAGTWFVDQDEDTFGSEEDARCTPATGYVETRGDCNDADASVHPGADDPPTDGVDRDCGGTDAAQPHVGLSAESTTSIQTALDAANAGETVWVGPGTYPEQDLSFHGVDARLISTHAASATVIEASGGRVFEFTDGEGPDTVLDGFTLTGGQASTLGAGGVLIDGSSPTLRGCVITQNVYTPTAQSCQSEVGGGGVSVREGDPVFEHCIISDNRASDCTVQYGNTSDPTSELVPGTGGGIYIASGSVTLLGGHISGNSAYNGGAVYATGSRLFADGTIFSENAAVTGSGATGAGGALYLSNSPDTSLRNVVLEKNTATSGGALYASGSSLTVSAATCTQNAAMTGGCAWLGTGSITLTHLEATGNMAETSGGAFELNGSNATFRYTVINANAVLSSGGAGGALAIESSSPVLEHCTLSGNSSVAAGGGISVSGTTSSPRISNSILAFNTPYDLYNAPEAAGTPVLQYNNLFSRTGRSHNLGSLDATNLSVDPGFVAWTDDARAIDDLHLAPNSPLRDVGKPTATDPDGSRADIGAYGGKSAAFAYYADTDSDGLYDGWERRNELEVGNDDAASDPDGDGLTNAQELSGRTHPKRADSDSDGASDKAERDAGSDAYDPRFQPDGEHPTRVPDHFPSIQLAINSIFGVGQVEVMAGLYLERLTIENRSLSLTGLEDAAATTIDGGGGGSVVTATGVTLELARLTIQGGSGVNGGGLALSGVDGVLSELVVTGNTAHRGGGLYLSGSSPVIQSCTFSGNLAAQQGGGAWLESSSPEINQSVFSSNTVAGEVFEAMGGGLYLEAGSSPWLTDCDIIDNSVVAATTISSSDDPSSAETSVIHWPAYGGGLAAVSSSPTLTGCRIARNSATARGANHLTTDYQYGAPQVGGGGIALEASDASFTLCTIEHNIAATELDGYYYPPESAEVPTASGGGLYVSLSSPVLSGCEILDNRASAVAEGELDYAEEPLALAAEGAGLYVWGSSPTLSQVTISGNEVEALIAGNVLPVTVRGGGMLIEFSDQQETTLINTIVAYNRGGNLQAQDSAPTVTYSNLYNPPDYGGNHTLSSLDPTSTTVEPGFLAYALTDGTACVAGTPGCIPVNPHSAATSPLVNQGAPDAVDADGSRSDPGIYGGEEGGSWDRDRDGYFDWYWPGKRAEPPPGVEPTDFDKNDWDATVH